MMQPIRRIADYPGRRDEVSIAAHTPPTINPHPDGAAAQRAVLLRQHIDAAQGRTDDSIRSWQKRYKKATDPPVMLSLPACTKRGICPLRRLVTGDGRWLA